jgi:hypothetical protein
VTTTNISGRNVNHSSGGEPISQFVIDIRNEQGNPAPESEAFQRRKAPTDEDRLHLRDRNIGGGIAFMCTLKPGEEYRTAIDVTQRYNMSQPGKYTIRLQLQQKYLENEPLAKSNAIIVTVIP